MRASIAELIHALPPVRFYCYYFLTLNDLVVIRSFGGQIDQGDEAASAEEDKGRKIEAEVEGYGS
jgi:hypothetical protein